MRSLTAYKNKFSHVGDGLCCSHKMCDIIPPLPPATRKTGFQDFLVRLRVTNPKDVFWHSIYTSQRSLRSLR